LTRRAGQAKQPGQPDTPPADRARHPDEQGDRETMSDRPRLRLAGISSLAFAAGLAGAALPGTAAAETVNVYNWSDYIGETTLEDFTNATGIDVNYDVYDSNDVLEAKLLAGNSGYDVVVPTAQPHLARQIDAGIYMPLDYDQIPNAQYLDPVLMEQVALADPGNEHAVIYQWGTNGFGYNVGMIEERMPDAPVNSWDMIFDPEVVSQFEDCGVTMLDAATEMLPLALHYLGLDPNTEDPDDLAAAEELLMSVRPYVKYFHNSQYINDLANGDICLAVGWSGDVLQASYRAEEAENDQEITYVIPEEGTVVWFDTLAIPTDAPNPEAAHAYINFVLDPEVMAGITNYVAYANAVPASLDYIDPEIASDPRVFPPQDVLERLFSTRVVSPRFERLRTRTWTRIRTGQ
jgi:putrescine transport system substrate-binding protein